MEWWQIIKVLWVIMAFIILATAFIAAWCIWRVRSVLSWGKSLKDELADLRISAEQADLPLKEGIQIIETRCMRIFRSLSPEIGELRDLPLYVRSIAACFHPHSDNPELRISISCFLRSLERSLNQFDSILQRPGLKKLKSVNIRKIVLIRQWYYHLSESILYRWAIDHKKLIKLISRLRFFLLVDPLGWLVYLSRKLTVLLLVKYLVADLYIFIGKLAIEAYSNTASYMPEEGEEELEVILEELDTLENDDRLKEDPQIQELRNHLIGFPSLLISNPTFKKLGTAIQAAALIIAERHFPDSDYPLQEATLGPLLETARLWAEKVSKRENHLFTSRLYNVRLETLFRIKNLSDNIIPKALQKIIAKSFRTYSLLKWPIKVYRMAKNAAPWKISLTLGWEVAKKAGLLYLHRKTFDTACEELERIYRLSRNSL